MHIFLPTTRLPSNQQPLRPSTNRPFTSDMMICFHSLLATFLIFLIFPYFTSSHEVSPFYDSTEGELIKFIHHSEQNFKIFIYPIEDEVDEGLFTHFNLETNLPHYFQNLQKHFSVKDPRHNMLVTNPEEANAFLIDCRWISHVNLAHPDVDSVKTYFVPLVNRVIYDYPYFNRSNGADHFLIQMFDNGPFGIMMGNPDNFSPDNLFLKTMERIRSVNFIGNYGMDLLSFSNGSQPGHVPGKDIVVPQPVRLDRFEHLRKFQSAHRRAFDSIFMGSSWGDREPLLKMAETAAYSYFIEGTEDFASQFAGYEIEMMDEAYFSYNACGLACWSQRLYHAMSVFTIPIIVGDGIVQAFEKFINWRAFTLKMSSKIWNNQTKLTAYRKVLRRYCDEFRSELDKYERNPLHYQSAITKAGTEAIQSIRLRHVTYFEGNYGDLPNTLIWRKWLAITKVLDWFDMDPFKEKNAYRLLVAEMWCRIELYQKANKHDTIHKMCLRKSDVTARLEWID